MAGWSVYSDQPLAGPGLVTLSRGRLGASSCTAQCCERRNTSHPAHKRPSMAWPDVGMGVGRIDSDVLKADRLTSVQRPECLAKGEEEEPSPR